MSSRTIPLVECHGTPRQMGVQHGEQARELIAHNRPVFVKQTLEELRPYAAACEKWLAQMAPDELEEMR
ncbi:MAG TPA: hypothetical protein P5137_18055, partial [Candidatus Brocadiia bacterium]|nr:hypothetical protein [Candidatus Brocadiia bacterium]